MIKQITTCPLGHTCKEIKNNELHTCAWFIGIKGNHPQTGEAIDEERCAMGWIPFLLIENSKQQNSVGAAIEDFRNKITDQGATLINMAVQAKLEKQ